MARGRMTAHPKCCARIVRQSVSFTNVGRSRHIHQPPHSSDSRRKSVDCRSVMTPRPYCFLAGACQRSCSRSCIQPAHQCSSLMPDISPNRPSAAPSADDSHIALSGGIRIISVVPFVSFNPIGQPAVHTPMLGFARSDARGKIAMIGSAQTQPAPPLCCYADAALTIRSYALPGWLWSQHNERIRATSEGFRRLNDSRQ